MKTIKVSFCVYITLMIILLFSITTYAVEFYNTDGYYHASIYVQNYLDNYQSQFSDAVSAWNSAGITQRSIVINTQQDSYINNFDFHANDDFRGYNTLGYSALYKWYGQGIVTCDCHRTYEFAIHLNDFYFVNKSNTEIKSIIAHEFGHAYGLSDLESSSYRYTSLMYASTSSLTAPTSLDVSNANTCWAPHIN